MKKKFLFWVTLLLTITGVFSSCGEEEILETKVEIGESVMVDINNTTFEFTYTSENTGGGLFSKLFR